MLTFDLDPADRRVEIAIAGEQVGFIVGPEGLGDYLGAVDWAMNNGFFAATGTQNGNEEKFPIGDLAVMQYRLLRRIKSWSGIVDSQGEEVPCTADNKLAFFSRYPGALFVLGDKLRQEEQREGKNSETSPPG